MVYYLAKDFYVCLWIIPKVEEPECKHQTNPLTPIDFSVND